MAASTARWRLASLGRCCWAGAIDEAAGAVTRSSRPRHPAAGCHNPPPDSSAFAPATGDALFAAARPRLFAIAYRMLGTRADAEDVLQDAWLRWHRADREGLQSAEAWLVTVVTRLAIDRLRAAKTEREAYVGWWLPEPLVEPVDERTPETAAELAGELSVALLWVLERLGPEERAAFLLRQVFDHDYAEIAALLDRIEAACRQMVHRASERVQQARSALRGAAGGTGSRRAFHAGGAAAPPALKALLADDVTLVGGRRQGAVVHEDPAGPNA
jgi:RNA polymerase sigma-70 factor (ECF subfamily)